MEIIGLPTGFVHLSGSGPSYGSASPKAANVGARGVNKEALEETMANLVLKDSKALPTPASPTRALKDNTNTNASPSPSPTKTSFAPPTSPNAPRRKPAPMVTPSVIRQAGKDVVEATDRNKAVVAALPAVEGSVAEADEKKVEVVKERQEERKELGEVDEFGGGVFRPYATGTGKARWDQSMKEIEEALMM
ncbi:F-box domain-containing protein [Pseudohyphozyma bogoriensis]|nr:F-box domain-containing protein [Pseudohyphozyma bogoriensis]